MYHLKTFIACLCHYQMRHVTAICCLSARKPHAAIVTTATPTNTISSPHHVTTSAHAHAPVTITPFFALQRAHTDERRHAAHRARSRTISRHKTPAFSARHFLSAVTPLFWRARHVRPATSRPPPPPKMLQPVAGHALMQKRRPKQHFHDDRYIYFISFAAP